MRYRYLKITGSMVWGTNNLTRDDLIRRKNGGYDAIIDLNEGTEFDPDNNQWKPVEGDS